MPGKSSVPARNRATATSSAAMSAAVARDPIAPASRAIRRAGKRPSSGARKSRRAAATRSGGATGDGQPARVGDRVLDRQPHVRRPELGLERPVPEEDGRMDDRLRMDDDIDPLVRHPVEPVGLDDLQSLVGERRGIDRDLGAHRPGRMAQGAGGADAREAVERRVEEGPARGREEQAGDVVERLAGEALPDRGVLRIDRAQPAERGGQGVARIRCRTFGRPGSGLGHHEVAARHERLLVGGRDDLAGPKGGEDGAQAHDAAGRDDHEVHVRSGRELLEGARAARLGAAGRAGRGPRPSRPPRRGDGVAGPAPRAERPASRSRWRRPRHSGARAARTSTACVPIDPPDPRRATRIGGRAGRGSAMDEGDPGGEDRRREENRVDSVEDPAVPRQERARVLGAGGALEERFGQVAGLGGHTQQRAEDKGLQGRAAADHEDDARRRWWPRRSRRALPRASSSGRSRAGTAADRSPGRRGRRPCRRPRRRPAGRGSSAAPARRSPRSTTGRSPWSRGRQRRR